MTVCQASHIVSFCPPDNHRSTTQYKRRQREKRRPGRRLNRLRSPSGRMCSGCVRRRHRCLEPLLRQRPVAGEVGVCMAAGAVVLQQPQRRVKAVRHGIQQLRPQHR
jgi:hypothetical protein